MNIINGLVFTVDGFKKLNIGIKEAKIECLENGPIADNTKTINAKNFYIVPGFIDSLTSIGLTNSGLNSEQSDMNEPFLNVLSNMSVLDGIKYDDEYFYEAMKSGVTSVCINSGHKSVVGARGCVIKTKSRWQDSLVKENSDIKITLGEYPKHEFGSKMEPMSRMGLMDIIRKNLSEAKIVLDNKLDYRSFDGKLINLIPVLKREIPLKIYANKVQDILCALRLKEEFNINIIITGAAEAYKITEKLKNTPIVLSGLINDSSFIELNNRLDSTCKVLKDHNIEFSLATNHPEVCTDLLHLTMCVACKNGLDETSAIKSVTINPAKIFGVENEIGSIEIGKNADLVIFDSNPTFSMSRVMKVIINGEICYER